MHTTILEVRDIREIIQRIGVDRFMRELITELEVAFRAYDASQIDIPMRSGFAYEQPYSGLLEWMPIMQRGTSVTVKMVGYHPCNPQIHEIPTIVSSISVYDVETGHLLSVMDGTFLTAMRTGAASALASRYLAKPESRIVGLIGAGAQAVTQLHALSTQFEIERVLVFDTNPAASRSFLQRAAFMNIPIEIIEPSQREQLVANVDILCTATSAPVGSGAVFEPIETREWLHINAVGSDFPGKIEVPLELLEKAFIVPDFPEQALKEGESQQLPPEAMGPALHEITHHPDDYVDYQQQLTVFDSTGWALEDAVASRMMLHYAQQFGFGTQIELEAMPDDPQNPYDFLR